jgi:anhydro-N-acetylmuramic acid kinase
MLFSSATESRAIVNLGGFCNVTVLPRSDGSADAWQGIRARDVCACNQVLDEVARRALGASCDRGGAAAMSGRVHDQALASLMAILEAQSRSGRSLGSGDEAVAWVAAAQQSLAPADLARTACEAIARVVVDVMLRDEPGLARLVLAGGSVQNRALMQALIARAPGVHVHPSDDLGIPATFREAICWAVLGALAFDGVPVSLPQVTGGARPAPLAGSITPARATYLRA